MGTLCTLVAELHHRAGEFEQSLEWRHKQLNAEAELGDTIGIFGAMFRIGNVHEIRQDSETAQMWYRKAWAVMNAKNEEEAGGALGENACGN
jgi:hypothetical protein